MLREFCWRDDGDGICEDAGGLQMVRWSGGVWRLDFVRESVWESESGSACVRRCREGSGGWWWWRGAWWDDVGLLAGRRLSGEEGSGKARCRRVLMVILSRRGKRQLGKSTALPYSSPEIMEGSRRWVCLRSEYLVFMALCTRTSVGYSQGIAELRPAR